MTISNKNNQKVEFNSIFYRFMLFHKKRSYKLWNSQGDIMNFYERIKKLMKEKNVTAKQVTQDLHISKNSFTYWKQNRNIPRGDILDLLANYFNCSIDYLLGKSETKEKQAILNEQPVYNDMKLLIEKSSALSHEEIQKTLEYVEFLKSKRK